MAPFLAMVCIRLYWCRLGPEVGRGSTQSYLRLAAELCYEILSGRSCSEFGISSSFWREVKRKRLKIVGRLLILRTYALTSDTKISVLDLGLWSVSCHSVSFWMNVICVVDGDHHILNKAPNPGIGSDVP